MCVRRTRLFRVAGTAVLGSFAWTAGGGQAWAELRAVEARPAEALARLADDPRLGLSPAQRAAVRSASSALGTTPSPQSPAGVAAEPAAAGPLPGGDPAEEMRAIADAVDRLRGGAGPASLAPAADPAMSVASLEPRWQRAHSMVLAEFDRAEAGLRSAGLPAVILDRHAAARAQYLERAQVVARGLATAARSESAAGTLAELAAVADGLRASGEQRPQQALDPQHLPFRGARPTSRKPGAATRVASAPLPTARADAAAATTAAADLDPTEDAPITPEIRALAASFGNQPLPIYNWVRNNIEFVPTQGSIQGAAMTLDTRRGNACDTASLLIALMRAAGVHARYVTGTVDVPITAAMNWVGGTTSPDETQQLLGQGGIPNVAVVTGGAVTHIRIDHVWVEAFIDYVPSRGAIHREGDTWVPMDPSFKLHSFAPPSALFTDNPITAVAPPGTRLFDFDETLGRFSNVDDSVLDEGLAEWVVSSQEYIRSRALPPTVAGILGGPVVTPLTSTVFAASLPYRVTARDGTFTALPASLRHYVRLDGFSSDSDRALGNKAFSARLSLPAVNSRRLGVQFVPATPADAEVLAAARAENATSLPLYLVDVVPVVSLDGVTQASGTAVRMGSFYPIDVVLEGPEGPTTVSYTQVAGDEIVVGVTGGGVTREVVDKRFAAHPVDNAPEYLHQVQLHYWLESDYTGEIAARGLGVHRLRLPSVGLFVSPLTASYLFGAPSSGFYRSRMMDVKHSVLGVAAADPAQASLFLKQAGVQSSFLEGSVFDELEPRAVPAVKSISAVRLLSVAASLGIPIYRVTSDNAPAVLPLLAVDEAVKNDISRAVAQGQNVLVPERNVQVGSWRGVGYIVRDELTGAGGYLISGGLSGGGVLGCLLRALAAIFVVVTVVVLFALALTVIIILLAHLAQYAGILAAAAAFAAPAVAAIATTASEAKEDMLGVLLLSRGLAPLSLAVR